MRFVTPDVAHIELKDGEWIDVKQELTVGEEKRYRSAGLKNVKQQDGQMSIEVDWVALALARVGAYLVDWSAKRSVGEGKSVSVPVSAESINALDQDTFDEIDAAIQAHIDKRAADTKNPKETGGKTPSSRSR